MTNNYGDRTHCTRGHEFNKENTGQRKDGGGRWCRQCKRENKKVWLEKNRKTPPPKPREPLRFREQCDYGHPVTNDSITVRYGRGDECRPCQKEKRRLRYLRDKGDPVAAEKLRERDRIRKRIERSSDGGELVHKNDEKRSAPQNALGVKEKALQSWQQLTQVWDETRTPCHQKRDQYIDFTDPRYPDDPEEQGGAPFPSTGQAESMCSGCPVVELCLKYALEQKEDFGVWGGKRIVGGRVYRGARKVVENVGRPDSDVAGTD